MSTKIGFNNFKAFGSQMQYFTKKPITLVYGPNSVGKSSLIRALLFREYLKTARWHHSEFTYKYEKSDSFISTLFSKDMLGKNIKTNMFGDLYDIGNFGSIVHKRDENKKINFTITYENINDIQKSIYAYGYLSGFLTSIQDVIGLDSLQTELNIFKMHLELKYKYKENDDKRDIAEALKNVFFKSLHINQKDIFEDSKLKLLNNFIGHIQSQLSIQSLKIKTSVNKNLLQEHEVFIDNILLFSCKEKDVEYFSRIFEAKLYTNNNIFEKVFFKPDEQKLKEEYIFSDIEVNGIAKYQHPNFFDIESNYMKYLEVFLGMLIEKLFLQNNDFENVYIGPIRSIPSRKDLIGIAKKIKLQRRKQRLINEKERLCYKDALSTFFGKKLWYVLYLYCKITKIVKTLNNSLIRRPVLNPIFLKPNSKNHLHLWYSLASNRKVLNKVNYWLKNRGKHNSSYSVVMDNKDLSFLDESIQTVVHPQDMGVGISQSLPIVIAANLHEDTNIFIEQPELHLHPKLQMEIADEFIRSANEQKNEFMIETHSEHLLLRIMKRMRQTEEGTLEDESLRLTPDDVCLLYVDNDGEQTYIQELRLSKTGKLLDHWPNGFFEEGYKERFF